VDGKIYTIAMQILVPYGAGRVYGNRQEKLSLGYIIVKNNIQTTKCSAESSSSNQVTYMNI
jgi:hypothetical protein